VPERHRILVVVEPAVLGDALCQLLDRAGQDDVIYADRCTLAVIDDDFDAVITSGPLPPGVRAPLMILLPDEHGHDGDGLVIDLTGATPVPVQGVDEVIDLLDDRCTGPETRSSRLGRPTTPTRW
jgi:hypothetical protein